MLVFLPPPPLFPFSTRGLHRAYSPTYKMHQHLRTCGILQSVYKPAAARKLNGLCILI